MLGNAAEAYAFHSDHTALQELRACGAEVAIALLESLEGPTGIKIERADIGTSAYRYAVIMLETFVAGCRAKV